MSYMNNLDGTLIELDDDKSSIKLSQQSLAIKYRPKTFDDLSEQEYIKIILNKQIKTNDIRSAYLFTGPAGCGKTTSARIFANMINENCASPIEIDAASNNGVEQIRTIINDAKLKPIIGKYKIYILDECHMLSLGAWNAMLKLLEEPPKTTIFIMCTTDPQKIPTTILSRVQRYDFNKISLDGIIKRLAHIVYEEGKFGVLENADTDAIRYIAKIAEGGMRDAISMLDKCLSFNKNLSIENVVKALGISDYESLDNLCSYLIDGDINKSILLLEDIYNQGKDLKLFIKQFIHFVLDVCKWIIYENYDYIQIPNTIQLEGVYNIDDYEKLLCILNNMIKLNNDIKYEQNPKILIESNILLYGRTE